MTWVCARCRTPVNGTRFDAFCPQCLDKTIAVEDGPLTYPQYEEIRDLFHSIGEDNRARRLRWISQAVGRQVGDYRDLTATEGATALTQLKERVHGVR